MNGNSLDMCILKCELNAKCYGGMLRLLLFNLDQYTFA